MNLGYHSISPELEKALDESKARKPMTPDEIFEQKVSWCYGMHNSSNLTKDEVRSMLIKQAKYDLS